MLFAFFFFKQKTAYEMRISDWSSDVCSSDLSRLPTRFGRLLVPAMQRLGAVLGKRTIGAGNGSGVWAAQYSCQHRRLAFDLAGHDGRNDDGEHAVQVR